MAFRPQAADRTLLARAALLGGMQAFVVIYMLHRRHADAAPAGTSFGHGSHHAPGGAPILGGGAAGGLGPTAHYLRDATLAVPGFVLTALVAMLVARQVCRGWDDGGESARARLALAVLAGLGAAVATIVGAAVHAGLFADRAGDLSALTQGAEAVVALRFAFAVAVVFTLVAGVPWSRQVREAAAARAQVRADLRYRLRNPPAHDQI